MPASSAPWKNEPVPMEQVEIAIARIKHKLRSLGDREVKSRKVGDWVMEELKSVDQVAYLRFASVYPELRRRQGVPG